MKIKFLFINILIVSMLLSMIGCVGKFGGGFGGERFKDKMFLKYDSDNDNYVNKTEYFLVFEARFKRSNDNKDSKVSKEESANTFITKRFPDKINKFFTKSDTNKDGYFRGSLKK